MKRFLLGTFFTLCALATAGATDYALVPFIEAGTGQAYGDFFANRGGYYSELGSESFSDVGSYSRLALPLGGLGLDLAVSHAGTFLMEGNRSLVYGFDLGFWGGAIKGTTYDGTDFASLRLRSLAFTIHADERFRFPLGRKGSSVGDDFIDLAFGPLIGINCCYYSQEYIDGIYGGANISPAFSDVFFLGFGLGTGFGFRLGAGHLLAGLRGEMAFTQLSSIDGDLGDQIELPWRILGRLSYEIPLARRSR